MKSINYMLTALFVLLMLSVTSYAVEIPQAIVFENYNMEGEHKHVFVNDLDLTTNADGKFWNDQISSIVVISGNWTFYADPVGAGGVPNPNVTLGPGVYPNVERERIPDNSISQIRLESES
jgi:Beta/Gamma crystallin